MNNEYHFLDSNIFLSIALPNSYNEISKSYFEWNSLKITSDTVEIESNNVINKLKNISLTILKFIGNYVENNNISDSDILNNFGLIKKEFLLFYGDEEFPFGFKKERFTALTNQLFRDYSSIIKTAILYEPIGSILNCQSSNVSLSFKKSFKCLHDLLMKMILFSFQEDANDKKIIKYFNSEGIHNPDARILLDAFKSSSIADNELYFVTFDNAIINNSNFISGIFGSKVIPKKPTDFLNN